MIRTISIRNFKSLRDVRVDLERFTVFVGPNGSGKSSVLQALNGVCRVFQQAVQPPADPEIFQALSRGADNPVELIARVGQNRFRYRSEYSPSAGGKTQQHGLEVGSVDVNAWRPWTFDKPALPNSVLLSLVAQNLMTPTFGQIDNSIMAPNGIGLHAALAMMALNEPDTWQKLLSDLRSMVPTIRRLRHGKWTSGQSPPLLFDKIGADSLRAQEMSEGTLLILGILTAMYSPNRPNLILLDDLDRGLHPKAQQDLIALLRRFLERIPDLQLAATTHSPYLLNWMQPDEVRMTCLRDDGSTVCAPLEAHPQFEKWKDEMLPGEMWSLFGEKWLVAEGAVA